MTPRHAAWRALHGAVLALVLTPLAAAQHAPPPPAEVMSAYRALDAWVREWQVPEEAQPIDPSGASGACVTIRLSGEVLGRAWDMASDGQSVWRAARRAMMEATQRAPVPRDALRDEALLEIAARATIDLQIAGTLVPLLGETFDEAGASLRPGLDGVAARSASEFGAVFPGTMLTTGVAPGAALRAASAQAGFGPLELSKLRADHGAIVYRFTVAHLAQPAPGDEPVFLHRGGRIVPATEVGVASLRRLAEGVARHIQAREWPGDEPAGMLGDYDPVRDQRQPFIAPPEEQALAAFALFRFARTPGASPAAAARAARFAWTILDQLQGVAPGESPPFADPIACAAYVAAMLEAPDRPPGMNAVASIGDDAWSKAAASLRALCSPEGAWTGDLSHGASSLAAYALAMLATDPRAAEPGDDARAAGSVRSLFRDVSPGELPTTMPWLAWAELRLAPTNAPVPAGEALRDLRAMLWARQIGPTTARPGDEDQVGGVAFTAARNPAPTWHTFRPVAAVATMFGDARLTDPAEAPGELARLGLAMRFLAQLSVDDAAMHMLRDREATLGGIREAVWSQRQPLAASTAGLLAVCEVLRAVDARAAGPAPTPPDGPAPAGR